MKSYKIFTILLVAVWLVFALSASALHLFENDANRIGLAMGTSALAPIAVFSLGYAVSRRFRQLALSSDPGILTAAQTARIIGFTFLVLEARGALPAVFALPAGYGDIFIGATATLVAWKLARPGRRNSFIFWQALGIADLVVAVGAGTSAGLLGPHDASMAAMTVLPLSLIPTFLVPLFAIFHIICIAQARSWKSARERGEQIPGMVEPRAI
jgi:hypothetical protein